jgi:aminopeptidase N
LAEELLARESVPLPLRRRVAEFTDDLRRVIHARQVSSDQLELLG